MHSIVTITLNPVIDKNISVPRLMPEKKIRCEHMLEEAGGGGINVSKALKILGQDSLALMPMGGYNEPHLKALLTEKEINFHSFHSAAEVRENISIFDEDNHKQYRIVMEGKPQSPSLDKEILAYISSLVPPPKIIVISGSNPKGISTNFYGDLAMLTNSLSAKLIVDTSGPALKSALDQGVYLIKPNLQELGTLVGDENLTPENAVAAAQHFIHTSKCEAIVVSMASEGAMLITQNFLKNIKAPKVDVKSTIGAGDSLVAGIVFKTLKGEKLEDAIRFGIACGSAATLHSGTRLFSKEDVFALLPHIH